VYKTCVPRNDDGIREQLEVVGVTDILKIHNSVIEKTPSIEKTQSHKTLSFRNLHHRKNSIFEKPYHRKTSSMYICITEKNFILQKTVSAYQRKTLT
jgi:hypothetical protein